MIIASMQIAAESIKGKKAHVRMEKKNELAIEILIP